MKTYLRIILFALLLACAGCADLQTPAPDGQRPLTTVSLIGDVTDQGLMNDANPETIEKDFLPLHDQTMYDGFLVRTRLISESEDNDINQYEVKPTNYWLAEDQSRIAELKTYKAQVTKAIEKLEQSHVKSHKASRVYEALCGELMALKSANGRQSVVLVLSDMLHNEPGVFSFYDKGDYRLAMTNPQAAAAKLQGAMPLPKMNGTTRIYIIHKVRSLSEQKLFDCSMRVFTLMLTQAGCKVYVIPNLTNI